MNSKSQKQYTRLRLAVLIVTAIFFSAVLIIGRSRPVLIWSLVLIINFSLPLAAAVMAFVTARQFNRTEPSRRVWTIIGAIGVIDCLVCSALVLPRVIGQFGLFAVVTVVGVTLTGVARVMLAGALWMMVRVYRSSHLSLNLSRTDYAAIALFAVTGVVSVLMSGSVARSVLNLSAPELVRWVQILGSPNLVGLLFCSVFGVMVWRYAKEMGGGLVARAWQAILLYASLWLLRLLVLGILSYVYGMDMINRPRAAGLFDFGMLLVSEYFLFLGATYQYEACTSVVAISEAELEALMAEPVS